MPAQVEFYFDVVCPYAYLAHTQIEALCARAGAELTWRPVLLGGLFRTVRGDDGPMPGMPAARAALNELDMHRWARIWGVPLVKPAGHPKRSVLAMRAITAANDVPRAAKALYRAYWAEGRDIADPAVVRAALDAAGLDGAALVKRAEQEPIKDALRAATDQAAADGSFGVPTYVLRRVGREPLLLWGQDRLDFLAHALADDPPEIECFFDYSSPFAYLGATQMERIAATHGARLSWRPFLLGGLFKAIGTSNVPFAEMSAPKQRFTRADLDRWAAHWGVPFKFTSHFPLNTVTALRMTLQVPPAEVARLALPLFRAAWADDRDVADKPELARIASAAGFDGAALVAGCERPEIKAALRAATDAAQRAGVCGAPTFLVRARRDAPAELFWGQDRLGLVERALDGQSA